MICIWLIIIIDCNDILWINLLNNNEAKWWPIVTQLPTWHFQSGSWQELLLGVGLRLRNFLGCTFVVLLFGCFLVLVVYGWESPLILHIRHDSSKQPGGRVSAHECRNRLGPTLGASRSTLRSVSDRIWQLYNFVKLSCVSVSSEDPRNSFKRCWISFGSFFLESRL